MTLPTDVFAEIYGAAIDPDLWFSAIDKCVDHIGSTSAALINIDTIADNPYNMNVLSENFRNNFTKSEIEHWLSNLAHYEVEGHTLLSKKPVQTVFSDLDIYVDRNADELNRRPDYQFLHEKFGIRRKLGARLSDNKRYIDTFAVQFASDIEIIPEIYENRMAFLVPHIAKAVETGAIFRKLQKQYMAVLSALNHVGIGLCVAESDGTIVVSNNEAARIMDSGNGVSLSTEKRLVCGDDEDTKFLENCVKQAASPSDRQTAVAERVISLRSTQPHNNPIIVEVSPLQDQLQEITTEYDLALIQMVDTGCHSHCSVDSFSFAYGLTKSESEVAKLILQGLQNNEIADSRNTSLDTAKTQISKVMRKGGVNSRVQLIRLMLKTDPPVFIKTAPVQWG